MNKNQDWRATRETVPEGRHNNPSMGQIVIERANQGGYSKEKGRTSAPSVSHGLALR